MIPKKYIFALSTLVFFIMAFMACTFFILFDKKECTFNLENGEFSKLSEEERHCYVDSIMEKIVNLKLNYQKTINLLGKPNQDYEEKEYKVIIYYHGGVYILKIEFDKNSGDYVDSKDYSL